jgi:ABC-type amino acid transport substrate-binding protein
MLLFKDFPVQWNPLLRWLLLLSCFLSSSGTLRAAIPKSIIVYGSEAVYDFRLNHTLAVVKAALSVNTDKLGAIEVRSTGEKDLWMNRSRALASIQQGKDFVHVISSSASPDLDEKLLPIRISIAASVLGERIFLVRPEQRPLFDSISSIEDLKKYTIGVGQGWVDADIMKKAGLRIQSSARYDLLFTMLQGGRFDLLTRAVHEGWDELRTRAFRNMDWTSTWTLSYPAPFYLYVNKNQKELAARLQKGLEALQANGTLDRLFIEHFGPSILRAGWIHRKRFVIKNPFLPLQTPLGFSTWEQWHKKADADLVRLYHLAQERFRPEWPGVYRPQRLIEQQILASEHQYDKFKTAPLIVRAADRPNDTHILAAIFALELALAQPGNNKSPYFRRPVQFLIDKSLDQKRALEALNELNPFIDVVATQSSREREKHYVSAPVDIAQGLMGRRVFIVRKKEIHLFKQVRTVDDLRKFRICVGMDWPDRQVLELAGIPVVTRTLTSDLFDELRRGQCHGITRAVYEVRDELLARPLDDLDLDPYLLLSYPARQHLFFARNKSSLAKATESGLTSMQKQGVLQELLEVIYGDSLQHAQLRDRRILSLRNPSLFEGWDQDSAGLEKTLLLR